MLKILQGTALILAGILFAWSPAQAQSVAYYAGIQHRTWPPLLLTIPKDTELAVQLVWDRENRQIFEIVHRRPVGGDKIYYLFHTDTYVNVMTQIAETSSFHAVSPDLEGTVTYSGGPDWEWTHWDYDLTATTLPLAATGYGDLTEDGITLHHVIKDPLLNLVTIAILDSNLPAVSQGEYEALVADIEADIP